MEKAEAGSVEGVASRAAPTSPQGGFRQSWSRTIAEIGIVLVALALLLFGARGCAGWVASALVAQLPPSADATIGKVGGEAMRARYKTDNAPAPQQTARVERIFEELKNGLTPEETHTLVAPRITVANDDQVNAFALPGGEVFVLTGLLDRVKDDDDLLRGVLAHELGHAIHRHGIRSLVRNGVYGLALSFLFGDLDAVLGALVAEASKLDKLQFSRSMEEEADDFGVDLLRRIRKDPEGLARFLETLDSAPVPELLSTHPDSKGRAQAIRDKLKGGVKE